MPQHSSKNYHSWEYQFFLKEQQYCWENKKFVEDWYDPPSPVSYTPRVTCSCPWCWEYVYATSWPRRRTRQNYLRSYFTDTEILCVIYEHSLNAKDCECFKNLEFRILYRRLSNEFKKKKPEDYNHILFPITFQEDEDFLPSCIIQVLDKKLKQEFDELHEMKEKNEKVALLARYGLTWDDFQEYRKKREDSLMLLQNENKVVIPKQKFIKVKPSMLQPDTVPFKSQCQLRTSSLPELCRQLPFHRCSHVSQRSYLYFLRKCAP